jgi:hypothetical protein
MSQPPNFNPAHPLMYESPIPNRPSGWRTTAWISLLVLGILYALGGLCIGGIAFAIGTVFERLITGAAPAGAPAPAVPVGFQTAMLITAPPQPTSGLPSP